MTLPNEELRALERTREFLRDIATGPRSPTKVLRERARSCLRHYPFEVHLKTRWSDDVCEHGEMREWCKKCKDPASDYPRLKQMGIPVGLKRQLRYVLADDLVDGLNRHCLSGDVFDELFGVQTCPVIDDKPAFYPWDVEAVLERMITGKLTGSQKYWD